MDALFHSENAPTSRGLMPGERVFGRYALIRRLGRGGMGDVWLARDESLNCEVALKFLPDAVRWDPVALAALKEETRRARQLTHPHIVRIHDFVEDESYAAISMEYVNGRSLAAERMTRPSQVLSPAEILVWFPQLAAALDYAHGEAKLVHRDLKPANVLLRNDGIIKLSDFGVARTLGESMLRVSQFHTTGGTLLYMSPQQHFGEPATPADDIYALGATLYELLTGKPPFHTGNVAAQIERREPDSLARRRQQLGVEVTAGISPAWEKTVAACLAKRAEDRPETVGQILARLKETADPVPSHRRRFVTYYITNWLGKKGARRTVLLASLAVALGLTAWVYRPDAFGRGAVTVKAGAPVFASDATRAFAAWNFDGEGQDSSGHGLDLTDNDVVPTIDRLGRIDRAIHFNGSTSLTTAESTFLGGHGLLPFTVSLWMRALSQTDRGTVLLSLQSPRLREPGWSIGFKGAHLYFALGRLHDDTGNDDVRSRQALAAGEWIHLTAVNDGREIKLYLNGQLNAQAPIRQARAIPVAARRQLFVGQGERLDAEKFVGDMDQIRYWRRALTEAEIAMEADPVPAPRFMPTKARYSEKDDLAASISREYGPDARLTDWDELKRWHRDDIRATVDEAGIQNMSTAIYVQRAGRRFVDETRQYFVNRFDGQKPDYYLAHDELGGMALALGSWFGNIVPALVTRPFVAPITRALSASGDGSIEHRFTGVDAPRVFALSWQQEFAAGSADLPPVLAELRLRNGRALVAGISLTPDHRFAVSLGEQNKPQLSRLLSARFARLKFTVVARAGKLHFRAVNMAGDTPVFQETVTMADFSPADIDTIRIFGLVATELTTEL